MSYPEPQNQVTHHDWVIGDLQTELGFPRGEIASRENLIPLSKLHGTKTLFSELFYFSTPNKIVGMGLVLDGNAYLAVNHEFPGDGLVMVSPDLLLVEPRLLDEKKIAQKDVQRTYDIVGADKAIEQHPMAIEIAWEVQRQNKRLVGRSAYTLEECLSLDWNHELEMPLKKNVMTISGVMNLEALKRAREHARLTSGIRQEHGPAPRNKI